MAAKNGLVHEKSHEGETNDWITPEWVIDAFDALVGYKYFSTDPCASMTQPWATAAKMYTEEQNGLIQPWEDTVWLNPPYGPHTSKWVRRLIEHGDGIALIFARTETELWQDNIFPTADGFLFPKRRIKFAKPDGTYPKGGTAGAPSAFIAWGSENANVLKHLCEFGTIEGAFQGRATCTSSGIAVVQQNLFLEAG
jgi:hypothetical protein